MTTTEFCSACRQRCFKRFSTAASRYITTAFLLSIFALPTQAATGTTPAEVFPDTSVESGEKQKEDPVSRDLKPLSPMDQLVSSLMGPMGSPAAMDNLVASVTEPVTVKPAGPTPANLARKISEKYRIDQAQAADIVSAAYKEAHKRGLDPVLVLSIIATESSFNPRARSSAGAMGLMQAIPVYHKDKLDRFGMSRSDLYNPHKNIQVGTEILSEYLRLSNGNVVSALQRYNGSLSDRSRRYSNKVFRAMSWLFSP